MTTDYYTDNIRRYSEMPVDEQAQWLATGLSSRFIYACIRNGVTLEAALSLPDKALLRLRGIGRGRLTEFREYQGHIAPRCPTCGRAMPADNSQGAGI